VCLLDTRSNTIRIEPKFDDDERLEVIDCVGKIIVHNVFVLASDLNSTFALNKNVALIRIIGVVLKVKPSRLCGRVDWYLEVW
jgi:hypothetical protein